MASVSFSLCFLFRQSFIPQTWVRNKHNKEVQVDTQSWNLCRVMVIFHCSEWERADCQPGETDWKADVRSRNFSWIPGGQEKQSCSGYVMNLDWWKASKCFPFDEDNYISEKTCSECTVRNDMGFFLFVLQWTTWTMDHSVHTLPLTTRHLPHCRRKTQICCCRRTAMKREFSTLKG